MNTIPFNLADISSGTGSNAARVAIIGAGPTGLSAAYHLGEDALLIEAANQIGGWCRSIEENGFTFDYAGHIMFSKDDYVHEMYKLLLGDNIHWQNREAWIYSKETYTRYPFQGALYGLPPDVIKECILGAIEARYGVNNSSTQSASENDIKCNQPSKSISNKGGNGKPDELTDCCADGTIESVSTGCTVDEVKRDDYSGEPRNFEEFIYRVWGPGIAKHFAIPYNKKLWAVPLNEMETSWLGGRVPMPDLAEMLDGALKPVSAPMGPNAVFGYPLRGGFQALMNGFLPHLRGKVSLNTRVSSVSPRRHRLTLQDGTAVHYDQLISTMPLPQLMNSIHEDVPAAVREAAKGLRHVSVRCVNLGIGREKITDKHWIYYPEGSVFHRIFVQGNASPNCNPPGGFGLTCEITYSEHKPLPADGEELIQICIADCRHVGIIREDDPILVANQVDMPYAYVVYDHARKHNVDTIRKWLLQYDIVLAGRYSEWEYYNSDHAFLAGKRASELVRDMQLSSQSMLSVASLHGSAAPAAL